MSEASPTRVFPTTDREGVQVLRYGEKFNLAYECGPAGSGACYTVVARRRGGARAAARYTFDEVGWQGAWADFEKKEPVACANLRRLEAAPVEPAQHPGDEAVPLVTVAEVPGHRVTKLIGFVTANSVISRDFFSDLGSDIMSAVGGNLSGIERAISDAVEQVQQRIYETVAARGGNAVIGVRIELQTVADKAQAVLLSGTCVRVEPLDAPPQDPIVPMLGD